MMGHNICFKGVKLDGSNEGSQYMFLLRIKKNYL